MTGEHDASAVTHVRLQMRLHQLRRLAVERGERLVEYPERLDRSEREPGETDAPPLALRQSPGHHIGTLAKPEFRQSGTRLPGAGADARLRKTEAQILERCEIVFD